MYGWGNRTRTYECKSQSLVPYRLGYTPKMVNLRGFEPLAHGLEGRCSIQLSYRSTLERVKGVEPSQPAWKAGALPLSYTRTNFVGGGDWI